MNVQETILGVLVVMLVVVAFALFLILTVGAIYAWNDLPRKIYNGQRQRLLGIRPFYIWIAWAVIDRTSDIFKRMHWPTAHYVTEGVSLTLLAIVLISHLVWAIRIIRSNVDMDARLLHFARYALWGSIAGIVLVSLGFFSNLTG